MAVAVRVVEFVAGLVCVIAVIDAAVRTFVLPRPAGVRLTTLVARATRVVFDLVARPASTYEARDRIMALYAPVTLLSFSVAWLGGTGLGFALMFHATGGMGWREAIRFSGSALLTLGFAVPRSGATVALDFAEAAIGLILIAVLIAYLPTIYSAFSRREVLVSQLAVRGGSPPTPGELLIRAHRVGYLDQLDDLFVAWRTWFTEIEETHTSLAILPFFRSTNPHRSWVTSAGCILDTAAMVSSTLDRPTSIEAQVLIRTGFLSLRAVADQFRVAHDHDPSPDDPISISREEYDEVYDALADAGVPLRPDREACWADFAGWRVNYDTVLLALAAMVVAPYAPWVSDRSPVPGRTARRTRRRLRTAGPLR